MLKGIIIFESGEIQQVGDLVTLANIIQSMKQALPELEKKQREHIFNTLSTEEIAELIKQHQQKVEILEP